jgi:hypothetical protein
MAMRTPGCLQSQPIMCEPMSALTTSWACGGLLHPTACGHSVALLDGKPLAADIQEQQGRLTARATDLMRMQPANHCSATGNNSARCPGLWTTLHDCAAQPETRNNNKNTPTQQCKKPNKEHQQCHGHAQHCLTAKARHCTVHETRDTGLSCMPPLPQVQVL